MKTCLNKILCFLIATLIIFSTTFLFACHKIYDSADFYYFNTLIRVQTEDKLLDNEIKEQLNTLFSQLDTDYDRNNSTSFTSAFNNALVDTTFNLTDRQADVINDCCTAFNYSEGLFDISIYPLLELWQFAPSYPVTNFIKPTDSQIENALSKMKDFGNLQFDYQSKTLIKNLDIKLDFGGILKGYATQKAGELLKNAGYNKGYVSVGGSSLYILSCQNLSIRHPINQGKNLMEVDISKICDFSLSTSGDYEKYYTDNQSGIKYSHVINPKTGYPTDTGVRSVSVLGGNGAFTDAITTACLLKQHSPLDVNNSQLILFLKQILKDNKADYVFAVYFKDGVKQIITNAKKGETFTLSDNDFTVVNI